MKKRALLNIVVTAAAVTMLTVVPALAAPQAQSGNLLTNPDFEGGFYNHEGKTERSVPNGWAPWWLASGDPDPCRTLAPNYNANTDPIRVQSGAVAASYWGVDLGYTAGLYQEVDVTSGATYRLNAYGYSWSASDRDMSGSDDFTVMRVGIDPNGGESPNDESIVWSPDQFPMDAYSQFEVTATATSNRITVWLIARPNWCNPRNDTYWDNTSLVQVADAGDGEDEEDGEDDPEAPQPTNTPAPGGGVPVGSIPVATPAADGSVVHVVNTGETLTGIWVSYDEVYGDVSLETIRERNNLTSDIITVGQRLTIIPAGQTEPTQAPTEEAPAEETPEPTEAAEVTEAPPEDEASGAGTICVLAYDDANGSGSRDPGEGPVAGVNFAVNDGTETVGTYITDGVNEPHCFTDLEPGSYQLQWINDDLTPTTPQTDLVEISAGDSVQREFGTAGADSAETVEDSADGPNLPPIVIALVAAGGVILVLGGIGVAVFFFIMRRNQTV
ncbi:MAG: LysM peptidoglycan-binding domain-containing protein [Anaerolineae bacterium]